MPRSIGSVPTQHPVKYPSSKHVVCNYLKINILLDLTHHGTFARWHLIK